MLSIYLDIVDEAKRAINKNIWYIQYANGKEKMGYE